MRYTFTLLCIFLSLTSFSQIQRGDHLITLNRPNATIGSFGTSTADDLGGIGYDFRDNITQLAIRPTYGYALHDRLVLGASLGIAGYRAAPAAGFPEIRSWSVSLDPYLRYYAINRERMGLYGQVSTGAGVTQDGFTGFESLHLQAGLQFPVLSGIRVGPTVDYQIRSRRNFLTVGAQVEIVLHQLSQDAEKPVSGFRAGSIMLGSQIAEASFSDYTTSGALNLGGHYFLTDRLAAGLSVGVGGGRYDFGSAATDRSFRTSQFSASLSARYYFSTDRNLVWYGEAGAGLFRSATRSDAPLGDLPQDDTTFSVFGGVGAQWFLRENLALEAGLQVNRSVANDDWRTAVSLPVGVRYFLR